MNLQKVLKIIGKFWSTKFIVVEVIEKRSGVQQVIHLQFCKKAGTSLKITRLR